MPAADRLAPRDNANNSHTVPMKDSTLGAYNIADLRDIARRRLPKGLFEYVDRGTEDEIALRNNRAAFERIKLKPRTLVDVSRRSQDITLFGRPQKMPIAIAPTGLAGLMWHQGEIALARAAAVAGIPFTLATASLTALEKVAEQAGGTLWLQLYLWQDRSLSYQLIERAKIAGYEALIITVDGAVLTNREYNRRNDFTVPVTFTARNVTDVMRHPRWMFGVFVRYLLESGMPRYENVPAEFDNRITARPVNPRITTTASLDMDDLRVVRKLWPRTLIVKGILHPQDAVAAADCGADAVVVSNHGGRNLDSTMAPIEVLPQVIDAVGKRMTVLVDSGFRRGSDVIKALALGAQAVLIGRATLYGTAVAGERGAARAVDLLREEIDRVLALLGCSSVGALNRDYLNWTPPMQR